MLAYSGSKHILFKLIRMRKKRIIFFLLVIAGQLQSQVNKDTSAFAIDLDEYIITANYEPTHYKEAIHNVSIITETELKKRGVVSLDQALLMSPSLRLYNDPVLGTSIRMRGISSSNVAILIDGVPVIGRLDGAIDLSQIPIQNIERIEIVEGALSNLYGNNAAGGVINIITRKTQLQDWKTTFFSQVESIGQETWSGGFGYNHNNKLQINTNARFLKYDQYSEDSLRTVESFTLPDGNSISRSKYPFNPKQQLSFGTNISYQFSENSKMLFKYENFTENVRDFGTIKRPQFNPYANDFFYDTKRNDFTFRYDHKWEQSTFQITTAHNRYNRVTGEKRYYIETGSFDSLLQNSDSLFFSSYFTKAVATRSFGNGITGILGANYMVESGRGARIINPADSMETAVQFHEIAPFTELRCKLPYWDFSASGRYIQHSVYQAKFTPAFHIKYTPTKQWNIRAGFSQGYRSPSLKELYLQFIDVNHDIIGNRDLQPETSTDYQLSVSYQPNRKIDVSITNYYTTIKDKIELLEYDNLKYKYDNISEYAVFGFQPRVSLKTNQWMYKLSSSIGYWSTNIELDDAPAFGQVFDLQNQINYHFKNSNSNVTINHRHVGSQPLYRIIDDQVELRSIENYNLVDASFSTSAFQSAVQITLGMNNILNVTSVSVSGETSGGTHTEVGRNNVGRGRSFYVSLQVDL